MHIIVVGLDYRTAPVEVREKFTFSEQQLPSALRQLQHTKSILECVIVATCNRTELYVVVDRHQVCGHYIRSFLEAWFGVPRQEFTSHLYMYEDQRAIEHLFRVASGLESMIIGETQILGQVRNAFLLAQQCRTTGTLFNRLFKQAVTLAKRAHAQTTIGETAVSISYAAVELGKRIFGDFTNKKVMILGAGKMSELTAKHLQANGSSDVLVVNRTYSHAEELARKFGGTACPMEEAPERLRDIDIVISSTGASGYVLTREQVEQAMEGRKSRPLFMIDIAVPRDLDPSIAEASGVFLYDIDDLEGVVESNLDHRRKEAAKIEVMIEEEIDQFEQWYKILGVGPVIRALQQKAEEIHQETMVSLFNKLPDLDERETKLIRKLSKSIVNQVLHDPILRIKELAGEKHSDEALRMFANLFALEDRISEFDRQEPETIRERKPALAAASSADPVTPAAASYSAATS